MFWTWQADVILCCEIEDLQSRAQCSSLSKIPCGIGGGEYCASIIILPDLHGRRRIGQSLDWYESTQFRSTTEITLKISLEALYISCTAPTHELAILPPTCMPHASDELNKLHCPLFIRPAILPDSLILTTIVPNQCCIDRRSLCSLYSPHQGHNICFTTHTGSLNCLVF